MADKTKIYYTPSLAAMLFQRGISLLLTARLSNFLIIVRPQSVTSLDIHFIPSHDPFTVAAADNRLAIGYEDKIAFLQDAPAAHDALSPSEKFDAVYVPRLAKLCGAISGRDMWFGRNGRVYVASVAYSAVVEIDPLSLDSFAAIWKPPHIEKIQREDRCHLNGICMIDGYPRIACMVDATSNERQGWRAHRHKGALVDMRTDRTLVSDLAMPHSPRWHRGGVWFCDSARGLVKRYDPTTGRVESLGSPLPGFARGLDFYGNMAFVAISKVRDTAALDAYPHLAQLSENQLQGVWMLPTSSSSLTAGYLHLPTIGEISDLKILPYRFPTIIVAESMQNGYPFVQVGTADPYWNQSFSLI